MLFRIRSHDKWASAVHDGYLTKVTCDGWIVRTREDRSAEGIDMACCYDTALVVFGSTKIYMNVKEATVIVSRDKVVETVQHITFPSPDFSFPKVVCDAFDPVQHDRLSHFYSGDRNDRGRPHGYGVGLWGNGNAYIGQWIAMDNGGSRLALGFAIMDKCITYISQSACTIISNGLVRCELNRVCQHEYTIPRFVPMPIRHAIARHFKRWVLEAKTLRANRTMRDLLRSEEAPRTELKRSKRKQRRKKPTTVEETTVDENVFGESTTVTKNVADCTEDESSLCVVCITQLRSHIIIPCGHMCLCQECAPLVQHTCPMCREPVNSTVRVYM